MSHDGQSIDELLSKARLFKQQGQNKKAVEAYRAVLQVTPDNIDALNEMGLTHIHIGEQNEAIIAFDLAISFAPYDYKGHSNKAEAYLTLGAFEDAKLIADAG
ncbi:MAG: tetratricopeptide repeat protein, partial [Candidatus Thorarchaeota archaeon]